MKMKQDLFQALADPTRRAILTLLAMQALTPNAMAEKFDMSRQAVSKHIKVLHECEFITPEHSGREIYYHFNPKKIQAVSYTHLRAHETVLDLVCRLLLEKKKHKTQNTHSPTT